MSRDQTYNQTLRLHRIVALVALVGLFLWSGCDKRAANEYASPQAAAYAMFDAFRNAEGNPDAAWAFLGPDTRARLKAAASKGPSGLRPMDYVQFGWLPDEALVESMERVDNGGRGARLKITTELGDHFELNLIRAKRGWQVELGEVMEAPVPPEKSPTDSSDVDERGADAPPAHREETADGG